MYAWTNYDSPLGTLTLAGSEEALTGLWPPGQKTLPPPCRRTPSGGMIAGIPAGGIMAGCLFCEALLLPALPPLAPVGADFRQAVWQLLLEIPYGDTTTYGALARRLRQRGISAAPQAVGGAVGHNPISILIPCHRCVGADGSLTGYAGGVEKKRFLLTLEGADFSHLYVPKHGTAL